MAKLTEASKERAKLAATTLSNLAVGIWVALIFVPFVTIALSESILKTEGSRIPIIAFIGALIGGVLYYVGYVKLKDLDAPEDDDDE
ncbi:MAG: hypothetical protein H2044_01405 [Rhizobiales bacterium]|uniref:hypothetical protein n=1 Tax=Agrobacterium tumefaciens TaxID=358 RepID=UPI0017C5EE22|nr:hypothetical protein [Agrobacterium tumefaciens]MBA4774297.1 hypothetical protein [Hyphomicrobiales bacterium]UNZ49313.1 hypothetical protein MLE07_07900 [Agrobacterium tumefaciens]